MDGAIAPTAEATIPLADDGLYRGDGVFEVVRLYAGQPLALGEHLDRLGRSAAAIELPLDRPRLEEEIAALLREHGDRDAQIRIVMTRGGRRIVATEPLPAMPDRVRVAAVTYTPTIILTGVKSLSYGANMEATRIAKAAGADEAVLVRPDGVVLEPPTSSIFWVGVDGELRTPAIDVGILESITRAALVRELQVHEGAFPIDDLRAASEAFLASTTREVHPVSAVDGVELAAPGPRTTEAVEAFGRVLERELGVTA